MSVAPTETIRRTAGRRFGSARAPLRSNALRDFDRRQHRVVRYVRPEAERRQETRTEPAQHGKRSPAVDQDVLIGDVVQSLQSRPQRWSRMPAPPMSMCLPPGRHEARGELKWWLRHYGWSSRGDLLRHRMRLSVATYARRGRVADKARHHPGVENVGPARLCTAGLACSF